MHGKRVGGEGRAGPVADLLHIARPRDREGLRAPYLFEHGAVRSPRGPVHGAGDVGQAHFHGVGGRPLRLLGGRIAQPAAGRAHVPKIAADKVALPGIVVQDRRERRIGMRLRLATAEAGAHGSWIGAGGPVQFGHGTGEAGLGHMTKGASFVAVHRELLVVHQEFAEQFGLLDLIVRRRGEPDQGLRLDTVDLGLDLGDLLQRLGRERSAVLPSARGFRAEHDGSDHDRRRRERPWRVRRLHVGPAVRSGALAGAATRLTMTGLLGSIRSRSGCNTRRRGHAAGSETGDRQASVLVKPTSLSHRLSISR